MGAGIWLTKYFRYIELCWGEEKSYLFLLQVVHLRVTNRSTMAGARQIFLTGVFPAVVLRRGSKHLYWRGFAITTDNCNDSFL